MMMSHIFRALFGHRSFQIAKTLLSMVATKPQISMLDDFKDYESESTTLDLLWPIYFKGIQDNIFQ